MTFRTFWSWVAKISSAVVFCVFVERAVAIADAGLTRAGCCSSSRDLISEDECNSWKTEKKAAFEKISQVANEIRTQCLKDGQDSFEKSCILEIKKDKREWKSVGLVAGQASQSSVVTDCSNAALDANDVLNASDKASDDCSAARSKCLNSCNPDKVYQDSRYIDAMNTYLGGYYCPGPDDSANSAFNYHTMADALAKTLNENNSVCLADAPGKSIQAKTAETIQALSASLSCVSSLSQNGLSGINLGDLSGLTDYCGANASTAAAACSFLSQLAANTGANTSGAGSRTSGTDAAAATTGFNAGGTDFDTSAGSDVLGDPFGNGDARSDPSAMGFARGGAGGGVGGGAGGGGLGGASKPAAGGGASNSGEKKSVVSGWLSVPRKIMDRLFGDSENKNTAANQKAQKDLDKLAQSSALVLPGRDPASVKVVGPGGMTDKFGPDNFAKMNNRFGKLGYGAEAAKK